MTNPLISKRILLGVTGSIACYKSADLASKLRQAGTEVDVILTEAAERMRLSARGYHRVLRVARTLADLESADREPATGVKRIHIAEALSYRRIAPGR